MVSFQIQDPVEILPDTEESRELVQRRIRRLLEIQAEDARIKRETERVCENGSRNVNYRSKLIVGCWN